MLLLSEGNINLNDPVLFKLAMIWEKPILMAGQEIYKISSGPNF